MTDENFRKDNNFDTVAAYLAGYYASWQEEQIREDDQYQLFFLDHIADGLAFAKMIAEMEIPLTEDGKISTELVRELLSEMVTDYAEKQRVAFLQRGDDRYD